MQYCRHLFPRFGGRIAAALVLCCLSLYAADQQPRLEYYRVAKGFLPELKNSYGWAKGTGFATENPWGQYTAFLMLTNARGQRTWRIEHYLPFTPGPYVSIPDPDTSQGSTMYLLEGSSRALLIDTANPAKAIEGVNDLKTVVRHLLGHENDGQPRAHPLDFVVAITHNHPDHIGENGRMSDRTIYYPDLDWPAQAPPNYVPIREGGGPTNHGNGTAVSQIDLGNRLISAVAIPPHSAGSTAYLDAENRLFVTGDAIGSAWPYIQMGPVSRYDQSIHHVEEVTRPYPDLAVLPAHFYQTGAWARGRAPLNGRPLDRQYITDMTALADGVLAGTITGEPFFAGPEAYWAKNDSAQMVYSLSTLYRPGEAGESYHAVRYPRQFQTRHRGGFLRHADRRRFQNPVRFLSHPGQRRRDSFPSPRLDIRAIDRNRGRWAGTGRVPPFSHRRCAARCSRSRSGPSSVWRPCATSSAPHLRSGIERPQWRAGDRAPRRD